jgi:DDE_Tnp_1-associated
MLARVRLLVTREESGLMDASIVKHFSTLKDPRIERHKKHHLVDILVLAICAVLSGAEGWEAIEEYGHAKLEWLRRFIPLENGVPTHDTIARVLSRMSAKGLQECLSELGEGRSTGYGGATRGH